MDFKKYISAIFSNKNAVSYQFKNTRTLRMALGCYVIGRYPLLIFPNLVHLYKGSLEMLIPLVLITIFLSIPLTFTALGMSQYSKKGWMKLWDAAPIWRGIGIAGIICLYLSILLNASISSYFLYYTVRTLDRQPPWLECTNQTFQEDGCYTYVENRSMHLDCMNIHSEEHCSKIAWKNSAQYHWDNTVNFKKNEETVLSFKSNLLPYQIVVIIMVYICLRSSTESLAIFSPFFLIFPTILHGLLLVRSFLHPGTLRALHAMCQFKFSNFVSVPMWLDIGLTCLSSTNFVYGGLSNFGTQYNFRNPINIDAVFVNLASATYSIMYTVFLYNTYGILSYELNIPVEEIMAMDDDINFIQCPLSFTHMNLTKFWMFIFYLSNYMVVLRSLATQCETFLFVFYEFKPDLKRYTIPCGLLFSFVMLFFSMVLNFDLIHDFLSRLDVFMSYAIIPAMALYFYIFIGFFYGVNHFVDDMHFMLGFRPSNIWKLNWYVGYWIYLALTIFSFSGFSKKELAKSDFRIDLLTGLICLIPAIYFWVYVIIKRHEKVPWAEVFRPDKQWGPRDEVLRKSRDMFSAHDMTKEYLYRQKKLKSKTADSSGTRLTTT